MLCCESWLLSFGHLLLYIVKIVGPTSITEDDLEAELEADLNDLKLDDIDTTDVNLDDEELLED